MQNWRTTVISLIVALAVYYEQVGSKLPETTKEWVGFGVGFVIFVGGWLLKDPEWLKKATGGKSIPKSASIVILSLLLSGCSGFGILQNPATDTTQQLAIMQQQNARGCVYLRASAVPWASVTTIIVGTWGQNPPSYVECWQGLPAEIK